MIDTFPPVSHNQGERQAILPVRRS
jgi:hypothetical protein